MSNFREVEYMEEPVRRRLRRRRRRRRGCLGPLFALVFICLGLYAAWRLTDGFGGFGLPVRLDLGNTDTEFTYDLASLGAQVSPEMYLDECGAQEAEQLRALAKEAPEWAEELEFMARHIGIYTEEAVKTALGGAEKTPFVLLTPFREPDESGLDARIELEEGELPYLLQYDARWCFHGYGSSVMGFTACGPTCLSMAAMGLTGDARLTPARIADAAEAAGHYVPGSGTAWSLFTEGAEMFGLRGEAISAGRTALRERLEAGEVIIASMLPGDFTTSGHFIVIYGANLLGFKVYDPNSPERSSRLWSYDRLAPQIAQLWSITAADGSGSGSQEQGQTQAQAGAGELFIADCEEFITLRSAPDVGAEAITTIPRGAEMTLIRFEGGFAYVEYAGQRGYVLSTYIVPKSDSAAPTSAFGCEDLEEGLRRLAEAYPGQLELGSIGESAEGRSIALAVVGAAGAERELLIQGGIHGREGLSSYVVLCQIEYLLEAGVPEGTRFHFIPMVNPDGVEISRTGRLGAAQEAIYESDLAAGLTEPGEEAYARTWKANAAGVDLNRNFDAGWELLDGRSAPSAEGWRGSAPEDQPESRALAEYTRALMPDATISCHTAGSVIYADYAGAAAEVNAASLSLAEALGAAAGYGIGDTDELDAGGYKDWCAGELGIPSVTVELGWGESPLRTGAAATLRFRNETAPLIAAEWLLEGA